MYSNCSCSLLACYRLFVYTQVEFIRAVWGSSVLVRHVAFCQNTSAENGLGVDVQVAGCCVRSRVF